MPRQGESVAPGGSRREPILAPACAFGGALLVLQLVLALVFHPALSNTAQTRFDAILVLGFPVEDDGNLGSTSNRPSPPGGAEPTSFS